MDLFKKCRLDHVDAAKKAGIYPYFHQLNSKQGPEVIMEGKDMIMIGSNNYLGLTSHPEVIEAGVKALERYGSGCSGSRFLNGTLDSHFSPLLFIYLIYILPSLPKNIPCSEGTIFSPRYFVNLCPKSNLVSTI